MQVNCMHARCACSYTITSILVASLKESGTRVRGHLTALSGSAALFHWLRSRPWCYLGAQGMFAEAYEHELSVPVVCHRGVKAYDPARGSSLKLKTNLPALDSACTGLFPGETTGGWPGPSNVHAMIILRAAIFPCWRLGARALHAPTGSCPASRHAECMINDQGLSVQHVQAIKHSQCLPIILTDALTCCVPATLRHSARHTYSAHLDHLLLQSAVVAGGFPPALALTRLACIQIP